MNCIFVFMRARFEKVIPQEDESFRYFAPRKLRCFEYPWHFHPEYELTLIVESKGRRFVGDCVETFEPGDLVFLGPNLPHCWLNSPKDGHRRARSVVAQFKEDFLGEAFWKIPEARAVARLFQRSIRGLQITGATQVEVAKRMMALEQLKGMPRILEFIAILNLVAQAPGLRELASPGFSPARNSDDEARIGRVYEFVNRNFTEPIDQPSAAKVASLTSAAFSRFFVRRTQRTFSAFVNEVRVGHACKLLVEDEDRTSSQICYECGFENLSNFNRRFRQIKGMSPREYRRLYVETQKKGLSEQPVKRKNRA